MKILPQLLYSALDYIKKPVFPCLWKTAEIITGAHPKRPALRGLLFGFVEI